MMPVSKLIAKRSEFSPANRYSTLEFCVFGSSASIASMRIVVMFISCVRGVIKIIKHVLAIVLYTSLLWQVLH